MIACTIVARNYLPYARVLAKSFVEHNPGAPFVVLLLDDFDRSTQPDDTFEVLHLADVDFAGERERMAMIYDVMEMATAVKPWVLEHLLQRGQGPVIYLDPDIWVRRSLQFIAQLAAQHGIVVTPHVTRPVPDDGRFPEQVELMASGVYNLGFIAVSDAAMPFLSYWKDRLRRDCINDVPRQYFVDQRWVDFLAGYFPHFVLRDETVNVAYWNADNRDLVWNGDHYEVHGEPLTFFHFSGYDPRKPHLLSKHQRERPRVLLSEHPGIKRICDEYGEMLLDNGYATIADFPYAYDRMSDGTLVDRGMRRMYREALLAAEREGGVEPPNPFRDGAAAFQAWLNVPAGDGARPQITRYLKGIWLSRPDLQSAFPDLGGPDAVGFLHWVRDHGIAENRIPPALRPDPNQPLQPVTPGMVPGWQAAEGVNVAGYLSSILGVGEAARGLVASLQAGGIPYDTIDYRRSVSQKQDDLAPSGRGVAPYDVNVVCVNADQMVTFVRDVGSDLLRDRYTVGMWAWETEEFPASMRGAIDLVDEIWMGSEFSRAAVAKCTDKPVLVFPLAIDPPRPAPDVSRADIGIPDARTMFLFAFDYLSVFERKNPLGLVEAYRRAFAPDDGAVLVIKSINGDRCILDRERLRLAVADREDIVLIERYLSAAHMDALMHLCDCYVSLHRSEGFGLTMAEAMALGKPVIATAYAGPLEYMTEENSYPVRWTRRAIGPGAEPYQPEQTWADPDVGHAAELMRRIAADPQAAAAVGRRAAQDMRALHSPAARAEFLQRRLGEIRAIRRRHVAALRERGVAGQVLGPDEQAGLTPHQNHTYVTILRGPAAGDAPTRWGGPYRKGVTMVRRATHRVLRYYDRYARQVSMELLRAVREVDDSVNRVAARFQTIADSNDERLREVERRLSGIEDGLTPAVQRMADRLEQVEYEMHAPPYTADPDALRVKDNGHTTMGYVAVPGEASARYRGFEDVFRGPEEVIRERQRVYIDVLRGHEPIIDIGCGRGELLDLLAAERMAVVGIDLDADMVERCRAKGHEVEQGDGVEYLNAQPDGSLGAIFSAQVVEHLDYETLLRLLQVAAAKLRPGGIFVAETVNPHALPALRTFWVDLTHQKPIFPEVLLQHCRDAGFQQATVLFPNGTGDLERDRISEGEYAVIATTAAVRQTT